MLIGALASWPIDERSQARDQHQLKLGRTRVSTNCGTRETRHRRIRGGRAEQLRPRPDYRHIGQAVTAQRDRGRDIEDHLGFTYGVPFRSAGL
jgi:hypothetical protein